MITDAIKKLSENKNISETEAYASMAEIMNGTAGEALIAGYLIALRMKGETSDEITGSVKAMMDSAVRIRCGAKIIVDTCGTGGDAQNGFNVSTAAAFIVSAAGFTVAKHGNRSVSSLCGSADVLEALGVPIDEPLDAICRNLEEKHFAFLFAPKMHPAMKYAMPVRKALGVRTIFNILGPLANPAGANVRLIGVFSEELVEKVAHCLPSLGITHGMVAHGSGYDEIALTGETSVAEVEGSKIRRYKIKPEDFGIKSVHKDLIKGGKAQANRDIILDIFAGNVGAHREMTAINAGACIMLAKKASGEDADLAACVKEAFELIDSGAAMDKLKSLIKKNNGTA